MKRIYGFFALCFFLVIGGASARADIDQHCLKQCVAENLASGKCLKKCSYGETTAAPPQASSSSIQPPASPHNVLKPVVPSGDDNILEHKSTAAASSIDYACFSQCLHKGLSYQLCEKNCAKRECAPTDVLCSRSKGQHASPSPMGEVQGEGVE